MVFMYVHALNQSIEGVESKGWATLSYPWTPLLASVRRRQPSPMLLRCRRSASTSYRVTVDTFVNVL